MAYSDKSINLTVYKLCYPIESPERVGFSEEESVVVFWFSSIAITDNK